MREREKKIERDRLSQEVRCTCGEVRVTGKDGVRGNGGGDIWQVRGSEFRGK